MCAPRAGTIVWTTCVLRCAAMMPSASRRNAVLRSFGVLFAAPSGMWSMPASSPAGACGAATVTETPRARSSMAHSRIEVSWPPRSGLTPAVTSRTGLLSLPGDMEVGLALRDTTLDVPPHRPRLRPREGRHDPQAPTRALPRVFLEKAQPRPVRSDPRGRRVVERREVLDPADPPELRKQARASEIRHVQVVPGTDQ